MYWKMIARDVRLVASRLYRTDIARHGSLAALTVCFHIGNGNQDDNASIDNGNCNKSRNVSVTVRDGIQDGRDGNNVGDAEVLELAQAFQRIGTEGRCDLVCIYTAHYRIDVNCFLDVGCIPKYVPSAESIKGAHAGAQQYRDLEWYTVAHRSW
jgi:hypothetical protein